MTSAPTSPVLGIDLGTTNSVIAVADGQSARVLMDPEGNSLIPSCVSFHEDGRVLTGHAARDRRLVDAPNTVYSIKRLIGRQFDTPEVKRARELFPFALEPNAKGSVQVRVRKGTYALPEISAMVLRHLREVAERALGTRCSRAVITVPANFNELQRSATQAAGKVAGLEVLRILNEPTAATLAYGYGKDRPQSVAVYDFGGGTFDVTILDLDRDVFEVVGTAGDTFLGGDDIDLAVAAAISEACLLQHGFDPRSDPQAFERVRAAAEWTKCQLSAVPEAELTLEELFVGRNGRTVDFAFQMTKAELDALMRPLVERTLRVISDALANAGRSARDIDQVVLVGGSTRAPLVREMVSELFGKAPRTDLDPDLVVAQGAAIHAWTLAGRPADVRRLVPPPSRVLPPRTPPEPLPRQPAFAPSPRPAIPRRSLGDVPAVPSPGVVTAPAAPPGVIPAAPVAPSPVLRAFADDALDRPSLDLSPVSTLAPVNVLAPPIGIGAKLLDLDEPQARHPSAPRPLSSAPSALDAPFDAPVSKRGATQPFGPAVRPRLDVSRPPSLAFDQLDAPVETPRFERAAPPAPSALPSEPADPLEHAMAGLFEIEDAPESLRPSSAPEELDVDALDLESIPPAPIVAAPPRRPPAPPRPVAPPAPAAAPPLPANYREDDPFGDRDAFLPAIPEPSFPNDPAPEALAALAPHVPDLPLDREAPAPLLMDVTPMSLGLETAGGFCAVVVPRNAPVPAEKSRIFSTARDDQPTVELRICQGESPRFAENDLLGTLVLDGLRPARRGAVRIEVAFLIDASGILDIRATDVDPGRVQETRIHLSGGLDLDEIEAMRQRQDRELG